MAVLPVDPSALPPLYILRHGQTEWNLAGRLQGRLDSPLTALGQTQAAAQAGILARLLPKHAAAHVSPAGRAMATAAIALDGWPEPPVQDARLHEIDLGAWQGLTLEEIAAAAPDLDMTQMGWQFEAPGGEGQAAMVARCQAVLAELSAPTVLVTHGVTSRVLRCLALGLPVSRMGDLPGGQGVVHVVAEARAECLDA